MKCGKNSGLRSRKLKRRAHKSCEEKRNKGIERRGVKGKTSRDEDEQEGKIRIVQEEKNLKNKQ